MASLSNRIKWFLRDHWGTSLIIQRELLRPLTILSEKKASKQSLLQLPTLLAQLISGRYMINIWRNMKSFKRKSKKRKKRGRKVRVERISNKRKKLSLKKILYFLILWKDLWDWCKEWLFKILKRLSSMTIVTLKR